MRAGETKVDFFRLEIVNRHVLGGGGRDQLGPISRREKLLRERIYEKQGRRPDTAKDAISCKFVL